MNYKEKLFSQSELFFYRAAVAMRLKGFYYRTYELLKKSRPDITPFKDKHLGERCFILGGGPSLLNIDLALMENEITFGVNSIFLIFDKLGFFPTYYAVEDWLVYEDRFHDIKNHVRDSQCFFPVQFSADNFDRKNHNYFRAVYEFEDRPGWPDFSHDASKILWIGGTVTYVCLQLAFYMGFKTVYLVGMDHNYSKPSHVITKGTEWTSGGDDPNHFHPDYFGNGKRWHDPRVDRMEKAYVKAEKIYRKAGRKIINATKGGKLEVFERMEYNDIF